MYKYSIGKGNNSIMVRSLFKNRLWWIQSDKPEMEKVNFMWTQIKNAAHMETLLCKYPNKKSGVNNKAPINNNKQLMSTPTSTSKGKKKKIQSQSSGKENITSKLETGEKNGQQTQ